MAHWPRRASGWTPGACRVEVVQATAVEVDRGEQVVVAGGREQLGLIEALDADEEGVAAADRQVGLGVAVGVGERAEVDVADHPGRGGVGELEHQHLRRAEQGDVGACTWPEGHVVRVAAERAGDAEGGLAEQLQVVAGEHVEGVEAEAVEQVDPAVVVEGQGVAAAEGEVGGDDAGGQVDQADRAGDAIGGGDGEARRREDLAAAGLAEDRRRLQWFGRGLAVTRVRGGLVAVERRDAGQREAGRQDMSQGAGAGRAGHRAHGIGRNR